MRIWVLLRSYTHETLYSRFCYRKAGSISSFQPACQVPCWLRMSSHCPRRNAKIMCGIRLVSDYIFDSWTRIWKKGPHNVVRRVFLRRFYSLLYDQHVAVLILSTGAAVVERSSVCLPTTGTSFSPPPRFVLCLLRCLALVATHSASTTLGISANAKAPGSWWISLTPSGFADTP